MGKLKKGRGSYVNEGKRRTGEGRIERGESPVSERRVRQRERMRGARLSDGA